MKYTKPPLSFDDQAKLLESRGMLGGRDLIIEKLKAVSYYRLSAYWHTFRKKDLKTGALLSDLLPGTSLETVWRRYVFDRQLRLLVMDAIERFEVGFRTQLIYRHIMVHGAFGYANPMTLPKMPCERHKEFMVRLHDEKGNCNEDFLRHFDARYGADEPELPLWMACELMSFGQVFHFFKGMETKAQKELSALYGVELPVMEKWLDSLRQVRNICAHHGRLWNRQLGITFPIFAKQPDWYTPVRIPNNKLFGVLSVLHYLLKIEAPHSQWKSRLKDLLAKYHDIPRNFMGFPDNWEEAPIWQPATPALPQTPGATP